jgi:uncharacterized protein YkwD
MARYRLVVGKKERILPPGCSWTIGTDEECDVRLRGEGISPRHARLEVHGGRVSVVDLASDTGTRVNDRLVGRQSLRVGDRVTIGGLTLILDEARKEARPAKPAPARATVSPKPRGAPAPTPTPASAPASAASLQATRSRRHSGSRTPLLVIGGLAAVAVVVALIAIVGSGGEPAEAGEAVERAEDLLDRGEHEKGAALLRSVIESWPTSKAAESARVALDAHERDVRREKQAREAIEKVWAMREKVDRETLLVRFDEIQRRVTPSRALQAFGSIENRVDEYYRELERRAFDEAKAESDEALAAGRFAGALVAWREYYRAPDRVPKLRDEVQVEVDRILEAAERVYLDALHRSEALVDEEKHDEALAELAAVSRRLAGTRFAANARFEAEAITAARRAPAGEEAPPVRPTNERRRALESLQEAELLASARRYREAEASYRKHRDAAEEDGLRAEIEGRRAELDDLARCVETLRMQIREKPERFTGIPLGGSIRGRAVAADEEGIDLELPRGRSRLAWRRMSDERLLGLLERMALDAEGYAALARFCFVAGFEERGHEALAAASEAGATAGRIDAILARVRGIAVPDGGFVLHRKRWHTPGERDAIVLMERIRELARKSVSADRRKADEALDELRGLGEPARSALIGALRKRLEAGQERVMGMVAGNPGLTASLVKALKEARRAALALIYDTTRYPYHHGTANPYGPNGAEVQKEVDDLVDAVRKIWDDPLRFAAAKWPELGEALDELDALDREIAELAGEASTMPAFLARARERMGLGAAADGKKHEQGLAVMADNAKVDASVVNEEERSCIRAVNEYRRMMGLGPVRINAELIVASRGHSEEMAELKYFAHDSPVPANRTPAMRARNANYRGGGVSENIARGATTGRDAHKQWCGSSGHHRNILGRGHTEVGVGQARSSWWTQMFGRGSARKKPDRR